MSTLLRDPWLGPLFFPRLNHGRATAAGHLLINQGIQQLESPGSASSSSDVVVRYRDMVRQRNETSAVRRGRIQRVPTPWVQPAVSPVPRRGGLPIDGAIQ